MFPTIVSYSALWDLVYIYFTERKLCLIQNKRKKIYHHTILQENDDLPLWKAPAIMRSKDAPCNTIFPALIQAPNFLREPMYNMFYNLFFANN